MTTSYLSGRTAFIYNGSTEHDCNNRNIYFMYRLFHALLFGNRYGRKELEKLFVLSRRSTIRIKDIAEYQGRFKESNKVAAFVSNFLLFLCLLFIFGLFIREKDFWHNVLSLSVIGQGLNFFDLLIIDLLWWRNTKQIRFTKIQEKKLYQNPTKHIEAFGRALIMYSLIALIDGYFLTLF